MLELVENWKDEAKALENKARLIDDMGLRKLMMMKAEILLRCADELMSAYLMGLE